MNLFFRRIGMGLSLAGIVGLLVSCSINERRAQNKRHAVLEAMSVTWGANLKFEENFLNSFGKRNGIITQYVPNARLAVYKQLLRARSDAPDLLGIDVVWPAILANDLVDLTPYLTPADRKAFVPQLLAEYTVNGRLVALPAYVDLGVLYYRPELLEKYGFHHPPETWDELERMAARIQSGERRLGNKNFWGYVWQGANSESGTCNALEWQSSSGGGTFVEANGAVHVRNAAFADALRRATGWIRTISPPAEYVYREDDSMNIWDVGQTAFMRNWASGYGHMKAMPGNGGRHFGVAPMPGGPGGHRGTSGGMGIGVSKYAANRELAIKALLEMTSEANDLERLRMTGGLPTHTAAMHRSDVRSQNLLLAASSELMDSVVSRPALVTGEKYEGVSQEYAAAVNTVLRRQATPEAAMAGLETKLTKLLRQ